MKRRGATEPESESEPERERQQQLLPRITPPMNPDRFPSQREMIRDVDRYVVGQRQAKLDLALAIERHYL
jgi:ATP-dependent protease Clp ATPase subunit